MVGLVDVTPSCIMPTQTPTPTEQQHGAPLAQLLGVSATARAMKITAAGLHSQIKRGKCVLRPVAIAGKRLFFDKGQVERAAQIISTNQP